MSSRFFLHVYSVSFKETFANPNQQNKDGKVTNKIVDENRNLSGHYYLKEKVKIRVKDQASSTAEKIRYKNQSIDMITILKKFLTEHCKNYRNLHEEKLVITDKDKDSAPKVFKAIDVNPDKENREISGVIKLGVSGYPKDVVGQKKKKIDDSSKFSVSKNDNLVGDYNFLIKLPNNAEFGYLVVLGVGNESPISIFKKSFSYFLATSVYKVKSEVVAIFCKTSESFKPVVKRINIDVLEKLSKTKQSKKGTTSKVKKKAFKGVLTVPKGLFSWNKFVDSSDKEDFVEKELERFYSLSSLDETMERNMSLTVEINGIQRNIKVTDKIEFSMGIDVTDKLLLEKDGRPQKMSFLKEARDAIEFIEKS